MATEKTPPIAIVWFKRDLRVHDHQPLFTAAQHEHPVLPLYIVEPSFLKSEVADPAHWAFIADSLRDLRQSLSTLGQPLVVRIGEAVAVLKSLSRQIPIAAMFAHEETTHLQGFERDEAVRQWAKQNNISFHEFPHNGIVRGLRSRDHWEELRAKRMRQALIPVPETLRPVSAVVSGRIPDHQQLKLSRHRRTIQIGGETAAHDTLGGFLSDRGATYITDMSSPITAVDGCSRLSPHLAYGTISVRTVVKAIRERRRTLADMDPDEREALGGRWRQSLNAFESRLAWRDHFIQKIEMQPDIETENLVRSFDGLRADGSKGIASERLEAWRYGQTGHPMIDACMRFLNQTGWLNFRMRAMLVSFAAHDLWLHWRAFAPHLARAFVDFEPGIHYNQLQMQSGTSGNRTLRIYDPLTQGQELDPEGTFVRQWVPELEAVPTSFIHAPHLMPSDMQKKANCLIGDDYPRPLVDHAKAAASAKERIAAVRRDPVAEQEIEAVNRRHGSSRTAALAAKKRPASKKPDDPNQLKLFNS